MTNELKQQFTLRITKANKTDLIVVLYDMILAYVDDAREAHLVDDRAAFKEAIRKIRNCMQELIASLHFEYEIAANLLSLYIYVNKELVRATVHYDEDVLDHVESVINKLREAYYEVSSQNSEEPLMQNSQSVYAGLTYNRTLLNESLYEDGSNRGIYV